MTEENLDFTSIRQEVLDRLANASEEPVDVGALSAETSLRDDLGLSSLESLSLIIDLEDRLGIDIEDEELDSLRTVGSLLALLEAKCAGARQAQPALAS